MVLFIAIANEYHTSHFQSPHHAPSKPGILQCLQPPCRPNQLHSAVGSGFSLAHLLVRSLTPNSKNVPIYPYRGACLLAVEREAALLSQWSERGRLLFSFCLGCLKYPEQTTCCMQWNYLFFSFADPFLRLLLSFSSLDTSSVISLYSIFCIQLIIIIFLILNTFPNTVTRHLLLKGVCLNPAPDLARSISPLKSI